VAATSNPRLLSGHTYFSRFYHSPDGLLVNHHAIARDGQVYFGTLKATTVNAAGTLRLTWWPGNEALKHERLPVAEAPGSGAIPGRITMWPNAFDVDRGVVLEGTLRPPQAAGDPPVGLYVECQGDSGAAIRVHAGGRAELGLVQPDGSGFQAEKTVDREVAYSNPALFRLLLKGSLLEFYLDDVLIECFSLPQRATGRLGGLGCDAVRLLDAWRCE
jgi:hypothetical protein